MDCPTAREALSASLDGEEPVVEPHALDDHLTGCAACTAWYAQAVQLDRRTRLTPVQAVGPDVSDTVLAQITLPRRSRWRLPVRVAVLMIAIIQMGIGAAELFWPLGMRAGMAASAHMNHEEAAFNLAFAVALLLVGVNTGRAITQVPVLASFVLVLTAASVIDLADGNVGWTRLVTHAPIVLGLLLATALSRQPHLRDHPGGHSASTPHPATVAAPRYVLDIPPAGSTRHHRDSPPAARRDIA